MKKAIILIGLMITSVFVFSACNSKEKAEEKWDYKPGVMYNGNLYLTTNKYVNKKLLGE